MLRGIALGAGATVLPSLRYEGIEAAEPARAPEARSQLLALPLLVLVMVQALIAQEPLGKEGKAIKVALNARVSVELAQPKVIALSKPGERRWGFHQFPRLIRYPGGRILVRYQLARDAVESYGIPMANCVTSDQGKTWKPLDDTNAPPTGRIWPAGRGEFVCVPVTRPFDMKAAGLKVPKHIHEFDVYGRVRYYRLADFPKKVKDYVKTLPALRWSPTTQQWKKEDVAYDTRRMLVWMRDSHGSRSQNLVPRTFIEHDPVQVGDELIYADYRRNFFNPGGSVPEKRVPTAMVSSDGGRSFKYRSLIARDPSGKDSLGEPVLAKGVNGELVCVIRRADQVQKSMIITRSADRGKSWTKWKPLDELGKMGVMPDLRTLDCGVMALSYGRPGVRLTFSLDGTGREWTTPIVIFEGDHRIYAHSCGYTMMMPLDESSFLLTYSDFSYPHPRGGTCKAILVRRITVNAK